MNCPGITLNTLLLYLREDAKRYRCSLFKAYFLCPGFKYTFWMRLTKFFYGRNRLFHLFSKLHLRSLSHRFGMDISWCCDIGPGFYIGHFGGIVVNGAVKIGRYGTISQGVTIGIHNRGARSGVPELKDFVYVGPGAKLFGRIVVGSGSAIGG